MALWVDGGRDKDRGGGNKLVSLKKVGMNIVNILQYGEYFLY